jgi:cell division protein FtsL
MDNSNYDWLIIQKLKSLKTRIAQGYTLEDAGQEIEDNQRLEKLQEYADERDLDTSTRVHE